MATAGKPQILKQYNTSMIQKLILERGPVSKPELAHLTNLSLPTVNKIVDELVREEFALEDTFQAGTGAGRKAMTYVANGNYGTFATAYYMDGKWIGCVANMLGEVLFKSETRIPALEDENKEQQEEAEPQSALYFAKAEKTSGQLNLLFEVLKDLMNNAQRVKAIGVGIPGIVMGNDEIAAIPSLPQFEGLNLKKKLEERYGLPVFIENDVKLMTVGYHSQRMSHLDNMVFLYIGSGIGGGILINGQLYKGNTSFAGEFGYIPAGQGQQEDACSFQGGSLEMRLFALRKQMEDRNLAREARQKFSAEIGRALVSCVAVVNPEAVVLYCNELNEGSLGEISQEIARFLPSHCVPRIYLAASNTYGLYGLICMCKEGVNRRYPLLETMEG